MMGFADQKRACADGAAECTRVTWRAASTAIEAADPEAAARRYAHEWDMPYGLVFARVTRIRLTPE